MKMGKVGLLGGFMPIPEGTHVFKIIEVEHKEDYGKILVTMQTKEGKKHTERFSIMKASGELNEGALNAFSYFAKTAMNDFNLEEIDTDDLVGHYIRCEVTHEEVESTKNPGRMNTYVRLGDKEPADGFDGEEEPAPAAKSDILSMLD